MNFRSIQGVIGNATKEGTRANSSNAKLRTLHALYESPIVV